MDFSNPALLYSELVIGAVGMGMFVYGRKAPSLPFLVAGIALSVIPWFVGSLFGLWGLTGLCIGALALANRMDL